MLNHYFIVLALSGGSKYKCTEGKDCLEGFLKKAAASVNAGRAKIISARCDTGAAEDIRWHANRQHKFKTFILVNMPLHKSEDKAEIFKKAVAYLNLPNTAATVVEVSDRFQLIAA